MADQEQTNEVKPQKINFHNLAPTKNADISTYEEALDYALDAKDVKNIALTGPYGAGKSSIIQTYLEKKNNTESSTPKINCASVSLATFKDTEGVNNEPSKHTEGENNEPSKHTNWKIERSILQQIFFSVDGNQVPLSRFKRLKSYPNPYRDTFIYMVLFISSFLFFQFKSELIKDLTYFILCFVGLGILWGLAISNVLKAIPSLSIKRFSLTAGEFESSDEAHEDSYLNKHLDELIYFFAKQKTDLVIFEDLDRFGNAEIFIKLREINILVNSNPNCNVKFLYAIKDDMFLNKDRSKFFEFIIPVVPVVNYNNSGDKLIQDIKAYDEKDPLCNEEAFLKNIGLYISDQRLIYNILNEYKVYNNKISSEKVDHKKLLSLIAYKNIYPFDFEKLHNQDEASLLYKLKNLIPTKKKEKKDKINVKIKELESKISSLELEKEKALELTLVQHLKICLAHLFAEFNNEHNVHNIKIDDKYINVGDLFKNPNELIKISDNQEINFQINKMNRYGTVTLTPKSKSINELEEKAGLMDFHKRRENINNEENAEINEIKDLIKVETRNLLDINKLMMKDLFSTFDITTYGNELNFKGDLNLFKFLITNGYLDESYHYYTSNYIQGSLTTNDRDYVIAMHSSSYFDSDQTFDDAKRVLKEMDARLLSSDYVLNIYLFDVLLSPGSIADRITAIEYLKSDQLTEDKSSFIHKYLLGGELIKEFIQKLFTEEDDDFLEKVLEEGTINTLIAFNLVEYNHKSELLTKDFVKDFYNKNLFSILNVGRLSSFEQLNTLDLTITDLTKLKENEDVIEYLYENYSYEINVKNIVFLLDYKSIGTSGSGNYERIISSSSSKLCEYIDDNIVDYIDDVFLALEDNQENEESVLLLLEGDNLTYSQKEEIIKQQNIKIENIDDLDEDIQLLLIEHDKFSFTWKNLVTVLHLDDHENFNLPLILEVLEKNIASSELVKVKLRSTALSKEDQDFIAGFLIYQSSEVTIDLYKIIAPMVGYRWSNFPIDNADKRKILIDNDLVTFKAESLDKLIENTPTLMTDFINHNFDKFITLDLKLEPAEYTELFLSQNDIKHKNQLIGFITAEMIEDNHKLVIEVSDLLKIQHSTLMGRIEGSIIYSVLITLAKNKVKVLIILELFNLYHSKLNNEQIKIWLSLLPYPYRKISKPRQKPTFKNDNVHTEFAKHLYSKKIISTHKITGKKENLLQINSFNK